MLPNRYVIDRSLWHEVQTELAQRAHGHRESGAFLLASQRRPRRIVDAQYYDDLDDRSLNGAVHFRSAGYSALWSHCADNGMKVVADIHCHPGHSVAQSQTDRCNPMIDRLGHMAIVVPDLSSSAISIGAAGVYLHDGGGSWRTLRGWRRLFELRTGI